MQPHVKLFWLTEVGCDHRHTPAFTNKLDSFTIFICPYAYQWLRARRSHPFSGELFKVLLGVMGNQSGYIKTIYYNFSAQSSSWNGLNHTNACYIDCYNIYNIYIYIIWVYKGEFIDKVMAILYWRKPLWLEILVKVCFSASFPDACCFIGWTLAPDVEEKQHSRSESSRLD